MIFLCDYYNQASKDLAYSLQVAGYDATTVVINPDGLQRKVTLQNLIGMCTEQAQEFRFLRSQLGLLPVDSQDLLLCVERKAADFVYTAFLVLLSTYTTQDGFNTEHQLFHAEGFGDVVVGTNLETFQDILLQRLGCQGI